MAVVAFTQPAYDQNLEYGFDDDRGALEAGVRDGWTVIVGTPGDDMYVQQVATAPQTLLYADNGSFFDTPDVEGDFGAVEGINDFSTIYVTTGEKRTDAGVIADNYPVFDFTARRDRVTTRFVLQVNNVETDRAGNRLIDGRMTYQQADSTVSAWTFRSVDSRLQFVSGPGIDSPTPTGYLYPVSINYIESSSNNGSAALEVFWATPARPGEGPNLSPFSAVPRLEDVNYVTSETVSPTEALILPSAPSIFAGGFPQPTRFTLPNAAGRGSLGIIPGTLSGTIRVAGNSYFFTVDSLNGYVDDENEREQDVNGSRSSRPLVFGGGLRELDEPTALEYELLTRGNRELSVRGSVDLDTGVISLTFGAGQIEFGSNRLLTPQDPGPVELDVEYAVYKSNGVGAPAETVTFFAGHDITTEVKVDLLTPGAAINVDSPLIMREDLTGGDSSFRATEVHLNARIASNDRLDISGSRAPTLPQTRQAFAMAEVIGGTVRSISIPSGFAGAGYDPLNPPAILIGAPSGAGVQAVATATVDASGKISGITVTTPGSGYTTRPTVQILAPPTVGPAAVSVAETVSFNAAIAADVYEIHVGDDANTAETVRGTLLVSETGSLAREPFLGAPASSVFVQAIAADVLVEGTIWGTNQTYLMQSLGEDSLLAPFVLSTTSARTGSETGTLRGTTIGITLANDAPTPGDDDAVAFNVVDLHTDVQSFRIRAATTAGRARTEPFPYELRVREDSGIAIDAVAASSFPIVFEGGGNMVFNAALATADDLVIRAADNFTLTAPVSTSDGQISITGQNVTIESALQVLSAAADDLRDDITLHATAGDVTLTGLVSATNNVTIAQTNRTGAAGYSYDNNNPVPITDNITITQSIVVSDSFLFDDVDVLIDIAHADVRDLSAVLVAPDGSRYRLFSRPVSQGANFTGTIFDSEAETPIGAGVAPFTGRFRPLDSLAPLYGRNARGTWRLQVTDSASGDVGSLTNFGLAFRTAERADGAVRGAGRVQADQLRLDVEGYVGDRNLAPVDTAYYLRTDVDRVVGRADKGLSLDELNDVFLDRVRVAGPVAVRANGVDPRSGGRALEGQVIDATMLDVSAPNGSIGITVDTARTIEVGNARALVQGRQVNSVAAGDVAIVSTAGSLVVLDAPLAGANARAVRVATSAHLEADYAPGTPGTYASTLSGVGDLSAALGIAAGSAPLRLGERVLVKHQRDNIQNGVYRLVSMSPGSWSLARAANADTVADMPSNSFIRVQEGAEIGSWQVDYDDSDPSKFGRVGMSFESRTPATLIGSEDPNDLVTFVVTTNAGTNSAAGSLGKMLGLIQANAFMTDSGTSPQASDFRFSSAIASTATPIRLTQELPDILEPLVIDGARRYQAPGDASGESSQPVIDGSRIVLNRAGRQVMATDPVNGLRVRTADAEGTVVANVVIGGFEKGSAIEVLNTPSVRIQSVVTGVNEGGQRLANRTGIRFAGLETTSAAVVNSQVLSSVATGVEVDRNATGVKIVGTTIGRPGLENFVGVSMKSGVNQLGVDPVAGAQEVLRVTATRVSATQLTVPSSFTGITAASRGLAVFGSGIQPSNPAVPPTITGVSVDTARRLTTITISGGVVTGNGPVTIGAIVMARKPAADATGRSLTLPDALDMANVFLGQGITGDGIQPGTVIVAIEGRTVTLSRDITRDGFTAVTLAAGGRNTVQSNRTGVMLAAGATTVTNSSIVNNTFNGVSITGGSNGPGPFHRLGTSAARSTVSNTIYGNGGWGVFFESTADGLKNTHILVQGNYLGTNSAAIVPATQFSNRKGNIGHKVSGNEQVFLGPDVGGRLKYAPDSTGVDAAGNQHGVYTPPPSTSSGGGGGSGSGNRTGGGVVVPQPRRSGRRR